MPLLLPADVLLANTLVTIGADGADCTPAQGHCYGADGGTGIAPGSQVATGRGGTRRVWTLSLDGLAIVKKEFWIICQYCLKGIYIADDPSPLTDLS